MLWALSWLGIGGLHRFYLGKPVSGLLYLCTYNLLGLGLVVDAFTLNEQVDLAMGAGQPSPRRLGMEEQRLMLGPGEGQSLMHALLKAAAARKGLITLSEAVMDTGRSFEDVEAELDTLCHRGCVTLENDPVSGVVVYRFGELEQRG
jgi:hypothetical protein